MLTQRADLTFRHNLKQGRHGWLRLTPAYSVKAVTEILERFEAPGRILDPFSGTGTTGLVCAERSLDCDLVELNPFLVWLAAAKTRNYSADELDMAWQLVNQIVADAQRLSGEADLWTPPLHQIERWWPPQRLSTLSQIFCALQAACAAAPETVIDLLLIAFCRLLIDWSNAAFNHQSMSFKDASAPSLFASSEQTLMLESFIRQIQLVIKAAEAPVRGRVTVKRGDSRQVNTVVTGPYHTVITSPPYPNRISYIRELRPYMYWLGYLTDRREAGELDWQAIGGTWGIATSRLQQWKPGDLSIQQEGFDVIVEKIAENSPILARYVHKYFEDIVCHLQSLRPVLAPGARLYYIVGNSKFYDTLVPVERIYASLFEQMGFSEVRIKSLRSNCPGL